MEIDKTTANTVLSSLEDNRKDLFQYYITNGITTDEDLADFIRIFLNFKVPNKVIIDGHDVPFDFVSDSFFQRYSKCLAIANRNGGKTRNLSIVNILDLLFKPEIEITSSGAVVEQANLMFKYLEQFKKIKLINEQIEFSRRVPYLVKMKNGASIRIITASPEGYNGPHPHKNNADEIELMSWELLQEAFSMTKSDNRYKAQDRLLSTRKKSNGVVNTVYKEAKRLGIKVYKWGIFEVLEKCVGRKCEVCPLIEKCQGRAKGCDGYYSIDDLIEKAAILDQKTWDNQWECKTPISEGQFLEFKDCHIWSIEKFAEFHGILYDANKPLNDLLTELIPSDWLKISGLDFGYRDPAVFLGGALSPQGTLVIYREFYRKYLKASDIAKSFLGKFEYLQEEDRHNWRNDRFDVVVGDPSGPTYMKEIKDRDDSINLVGAINDREFGYDSVRQFLEMNPGLDIPNLIVLEHCTNTIRECQDLEGSNSIANSEFPDPSCDDHAVDSLRYICAELRAYEMRKNESKTSSVQLIGG